LAGVRLAGGEAAWGGNCEGPLSPGEATEKIEEKGQEVRADSWGEILMEENRGQTLGEPQVGKLNLDQERRGTWGGGVSIDERRAQLLLGMSPTQPFHG